MSKRAAQRYSASVFVAVAVFVVVAAGADAPPARPADGSAAFAEAIALHLSGRSAEALAAYQALADSGLTGPRAAQVAYALGALRAEVGDHSAAVAAFLAVVDAHGGSTLADDALMEAARITTESLGRHDKAVELFDRLRSQYGRSPLTRAALLESGLAMERSGRFDEALTRYDELLLFAKRSAHAARSPVTVPVAADRRAFILVNSQGDRRALEMYRDAERLARRAATRKEALLTCIRLVGLYPESPLVDDAFAQMLRIHLARGDEPAARQSLRRLLKSEPATLQVEPIRSCAAIIGAWLLSDLDQRVASEAEVFPELFGYKAGENIRSADASHAGTTVLAFESRMGTDASRRLSLRITVGRPEEPSQATYPNLNLRVETRIDTTSEMVAGELGEALADMQQTLGLLDRAAARTSVDADTVR